MPLVGQGVEYDDAIYALSQVLSKHISPVRDNAPSADAIHFRCAYLAKVEDFWGKEQASTGLENLSRAVQNLWSSYHQVPRLVGETLTARARGLDDQKKEEFLKNTTLDIVPISQLPKRDTTEAAEALESIVRHKDALLSAIRVVRTELPEGMPTRNRPGKAYAVIGAAVEVSTGRKGMNIPKSVDRSGPFYRMLLDLFELLEVKESVPGAFRGWRKHMDGKDEDFDLMPI